MRNKYCAVKQEIDLFGYALDSQGTAIITANALRNGQKTSLRLAVQKLCANACIVSDNAANKMILGSNSSRRIDIMAKMMSIPINPVKFDCNEYVYDVLSIEQQVQNIAIQKMLALVNGNQFKLGKSSVLLTSDTMIQVNGKLTGKLDKDRKSLVDIYGELIDLLGSEVTAVTGYCLFDVNTGSLEIGADVTKVKFRGKGEKLTPMDQNLLKEVMSDNEYKYLERYHPLTYVDNLVISYFVEGKYKGKAGGFGIQDREFFICVKEVIGDPFVVVGLPVKLLKSLMKDKLSDVDLEMMFWPEEIEVFKIKREK